MFYREYKIDAIVLAQVKDQPAGGNWSYIALN